MLTRLERHLGRFAVPNLTIALIAAQTLGLALAMVRPDRVDLLAIRWDLVLAGEVWRPLTVLAYPALTEPSLLGLVFFICGLQLFYIMGTSLEHHWGMFRYNVYLLIAYAATLAAAGVFPSEPASGTFIGISVFLAFAFLYPDFEVLLFFILPVKVKWLALLSWIGLGIGLLAGDWLMRALLVASVLNFFLFLGPDVARMVVSRQRRMHRRAAATPPEGEAFHRCVVCRRTERSHPQLEFRYCPQCADSPCYCTDHIHSHEHRDALQKGRSRMAG